MVLDGPGTEAPETGEIRSRLDAHSGVGAAKAPGTSRAAVELASLFEAVTAVGPETDRPVLLQRIVGAAGSSVSADFVAMGVTGPEGRLEQFVYEGMPPAERQRACRLVRDDELLNSFLADGASSERFDDVVLDPRCRWLAPPDGSRIGPFLGVPITVDGSMFAALYLARLQGKAPFDDGDRRLVEALAGAAAGAIANAALFDEHHRRRQSFEVLQSVSISVLSGASLAHVLSFMAGRAAEILDANLVTVALTTDEPDRLEIAAAVGQRADQWVGTFIPSRATPGGAVIASGVCASGEAFAATPLSLERSPDAMTGPWLSVPLWSQGRPSGALSVHRSPDRPAFGDGDLDWARGLAARASVALEHGAAQRRHRDISDALVRSSLPSEFPVVAELDIASRYVPCESGVGGDFYELFELRGNTWGLVIGDACGHGPVAASVASLALHTVRAAAATAKQPSGILGQLNAAFRRSSPVCTGTAVYAHIRPGARTTRVTLARAGHPYPILCRTDGTVSTLEPNGPLLGAFEAPKFSSEFVVLDPGDALIFYTDGVSEARGTDGDEFGIDRLLETIRSGAELSAEAVVDRIHTAVTAHAAKATDDLAIVVIAPLPA